MDHSDQPLGKFVDETVDLRIGSIEVRQLNHDRGDVSCRGTVNNAFDIMQRQAVRLNQAGKLLRNDDTDIRERSHQFPAALRGNAKCF